MRGKELLESTSKVLTRMGCFAELLECWRPEIRLGSVFERSAL